MIKMKKTLVALLAGILIMCAIAGCSGVQSAPSSSQSAGASATAVPASTKIDTFTIGTTMDIKSIARSDYYYNVLTGTLSHMALVRADENGAIQLMMADYSTQDAKTWSFKIKDGLTWHDGTPVTAEDVKFTIEYIDEKEKTGIGEKLEAINITGDKTFDLVYKSASIRALGDLTTLRILPRHIFEKVDDYAGFADNSAAIGCGPYQFIRFDANAGVIEYKAYDSYVDGVPNIKQIFVKLYKNADTMYMALKSGEIDMVYFYAGGVDSSAAADLKAARNITLSVIKDTSNPVVVVFNNAKEPVNTLPVRQAIAAAIDYNKCRELFGSEYSAASNYGFIPVGTEGYVETEPLVRNLDRAKELLSRVGAVDSDKDGILELNGSPLTIELLIRSDKPIYARVGELLQANLKEAGINVTFNTVDVPTFRSISEKEHTNTAMISRFTAFGMSMGGGMGTSYLDGRLDSNAQGQVMDTMFAAIVDKLKSSVTKEDYATAAKECQEYYAANVPAIALYWDSYIQACNSSYNGFVTDGTFGIVNQATWFNINKK